MWGQTLRSTTGDANDGLSQASQGGLDGGDGGGESRVRGHFDYSS